MDTPQTYVAAEGDVITGFSYYTRSAIEVAMSAYNLVGKVPQNRLDANALLNGGAKDWYSVSGLSQPLVAGTEYSVAVGPTGAGTILYYDAGAGTTSRTGYTPPENPWNPLALWEDRRYSVYATYQGSALPEPAPSRRPQSRSKVIKRGHPFPRNLRRGR